jgi:hypothetical protein
MSTTPDSYHRTEDFETRIDSVLLPDEAWGVFAQLEKPATVAQIAEAIGADAGSVQKQIDLLVLNKLARKKLVNWRDFLAQKGISTGPTRMSPAGPQPAPAVLAAQARKPVAEVSAAAPTAPAPAPKPATPEPTISRSVTPAVRIAPRVAEPAPLDPDGTITFRLANDGAHRTRRASLAMCITFRLGAHTEQAATRVTSVACSTIAAEPPPPPVAVAVPEPEPVLVAAGGGAPDAIAPQLAESPFTPRRLRSLIDAITRKGGGGLNGQLLVYRVFLRVPPALMFAAGIKSLNLIDDSLELSDARAYDAIRTAARTVASLDLDTVAV